MSFFIPMAFQENTPLPVDPDVYIEERPAMNVAALRFPGYPGDVDFGIKVIFFCAGSQGRRNIEYQIISRVLSSQDISKHILLPPLNIN